MKRIPIFSSLSTLKVISQGSYFQIVFPGAEGNFVGSGSREKDAQGLRLWLPQLYLRLT